MTMLRTTFSAALLACTLASAGIAQERIESPETPTTTEAPTAVTPPGTPDVETRVFNFAIGSGGYMGVRLDEVTPKNATELKLREERGAIVAEVMEKSPAAEAGLQKNDVVIWWNETRVESAAQLARLVRETPPGRTVKIGLLRGGVERKLSVKVGERTFDSGGPGGMRMFIAPEKFNLDIDPDQFHMNISPEQFDLRIDPKAFEELGKMGEKFEGSFDTTIFQRLFVGGRPRLGVELQSMSGQLATYFGVADGKGALISNVTKDSPAEKGGLTAGDVVVAVDGQKVNTSCELKSIIGTKEGEVDLTVIRNKAEQHVKVTLPKVEETKGNKELRQLEREIEKNRTAPKGEQTLPLGNPEFS